MMNGLRSFLILLASCLLSSEGTAKERSKSVCLSEMATLDAESLFLCGDCYKSGNCGFEPDLDKAFSAYRLAGEQGLALGYSNAAWVMLNQHRVPEERRLFEQLVERGRNDSVGVSQYLSLMDRLAWSNRKGLEDLYSSFEAAAFKGGLPSNLLAMYFMLEHSPCKGQQNDLLARQEKLLESQQYGRPFTLEQWNQKVDRDAILKANATVLYSLNPNWSNTILKGPWCRKVTLPRG